VRRGVGAVTFGNDGLQPLTVRQYRRDGLLVEQVRQALANPAVASHNAETLAAALNMSARSLYRQLQEKGA